MEKKENNILFSLKLRVAISLLKYVDEELIKALKELYFAFLS